MEEDWKKWLYWAIPVVVVIGLGAALYYGRTHKEPEPEPVAQTEPAPSVEPPVKNPVESVEDDKPLPALAESDSSVHESLSGIFGRSLDSFLVPQDIIRHVVVTVDNLPRKKTAVQLWPIKQTPGQLATTGAEETAISPENYARYAPIIKLVQSADSAQVAALYKRFYPLFQQAYVDLGYPEGYFNDRLVEVIDHLLATPDVPGTIKLTQPGVFYQFADPALEERSAGQKTLIRMGSENAKVVKTKLRELRKAVASGTGSPQ